MYKDRIKQWRLGKYSREQEMRAIVRKRHQRAAQHQRSIFQVRGKTVNDQDILRYFTRKGLSISDVMAQPVASKTPEAVVCLTPSPSPIASPEVLKLPELLFSMVRDYVNGSFDAGIWIKTEQMELCYSVKEGKTFSNNNSIDRFVDQYREAYELHTIGACQEAELVLGSARTPVRETLLCEEPETLPALFDELFQVYAKAPQMALHMVSMITTSGASTLEEQHPFRKIFGCLSELEHSDFTEACLKCLHVLSDQFENNLGALHIDSLGARCYGTSTGLEDMWDLLHKCHANLGIYDYRTTMVHLRVAERLYEVGNNRLARQNCYEIVKNAHLIQPGMGMSQTKSATIMRAEGLFGLANCQRALSEVCPALMSLREAIDLRLSFWGSHDSTARHWILILQSWLNESGQEAEAAEVGYWWSAIAHAPAELRK